MSEARRHPLRGLRWTLVLWVIGVAACVTPWSADAPYAPADPPPRTGRVVQILERPGAGAAQPTTYEVKVRLDDGQAQTLEFLAFLPYSLGQAVTLSPGDLGPHAAPDTPPPPDTAAAGAPTTVATASGQWVYTRPYGWVWAPAHGVYSYAPGYTGVSPYTSVYLTGRGWLWVDAPWLWRWAPALYPTAYYGLGARTYRSWGPSRWRNTWGRGRWGGGRGGRGHRR